MIPFKDIIVKIEKTKQKNQAVLYLSMASFMIKNSITFLKILITNIIKMFHQCFISTQTTKASKTLGSPCY